MQGKIIKGIGGFYYVQCTDGGLYECRAKGIFRNRNIKPLVGDNAEIEILDKGNKLGNINEILPRTNFLIRPEVANVDQTVIIFAASNPEPNFNLLDRFLVNMEKYDIPPVICFNKTDLPGYERFKDACNSYRKTGYRVIFMSTVTGEGMEELKCELSGRTTVLSGPSGVGKSSTLNYIKPDAGVKTGDLSVKIQRGKQTTRHSELIRIGNDTFILDTPGFSSLLVEHIEACDLKNYYPEMQPYLGKCRFNMCNHINEPDCLVKDAVRQGIISSVRYDNYCQIYKELNERRKW